MGNSILDAIGNTPLVEIKHLNPNPRVKIFAKLEYFNPGGSIKDRPALSMIEAGERSGDLTPDKTVIEATSGNTGIGLAMVCSVKGYKLLLTMSEAVSTERYKILKARGADILLTPSHLGTDGAIEEVYRLALETPETYYITDQFNNEANWKAHYHGTAQEIWQQTKGKVSTVVATLGTSGTLMGIHRRLKEYNPEIRIVGVEPYLGHSIQGLKNMKEAYRPEIYDKKRLDEKVNIDDEVAFEMTRELAKVEGIFVGMSSGAAMAVAISQAESMEKGMIVVVFPDSGERYLSTPIFDVQGKSGFTLFNTMNRCKEPFDPIFPGKVSLYTCGPTVHARMHLGECRRFVFSDLVGRFIEYQGYSTNHIINITDHDDKTIKHSADAGETIEKFTEKFITAFKKDLEILGVKPPLKYVKTSEHLEDMVKLCEKLVEKGFAYEKLKSIYFDISRLADYGKFSKIDLNKIRIGATVDLDEYEKDNPRDFTLLKRSKLPELKRGIFTSTKWGSMRPSWHLQCSTLTMKYLGDKFDIHIGDSGLIFPHHENEIAISKALTGKNPAKFWLHCDPVMINGKKAGTRIPRINIGNLIKQGYSGRVIRYWLIGSHYRRPIEFSSGSLESAKHSLKRLDNCILSLLNVRQGKGYPELNQLLYNLKHGFNDALSDDFNISAAFASIFKVARQINLLIGQNSLDEEDASKILDEFRNINSILNIFNFNDSEFDPEIQDLIKKREQARSEKNWGLADEIRDQLKSRGIIVKDLSKVGV